MNLSERFPVEIKLQGGKYFTKHARIPIEPSMVMTLQGRLIQVKYKGLERECPVEIILEAMRRDKERERILCANAFTYSKDYEFKDGHSEFNRRAYLRLKTIPEVDAQAEREAMRGLNKKVNEN